MNIFEAGTYKEFLLKRLKAMPKEGHGQIGRIAQVLSMHPTRLSHVLNGDVNLTMEQAVRMTQHLGLSTIETDYFLALVQLERAGSEPLKAVLRGQIQKLKEQSKELKYRVPKDIVLSENQKAIFYSNWIYSAIRLASSIEELQTLDAIAENFQISRDKVRVVLDFLLEAGLVIEKSGSFTVGPQTTHLEKSSPLVLRHHCNWRLKAITRHERITESEIAYTCPVSINKEDQVIVREMIMQLIEKFLKKVVSTDVPNSLACLNIDWFNIEK